ncbi:DUF4232 domain-containing protein [Spirilliplanes yamanashiensis]|uniref:DUF4232 domain-containing protein n=1 Tax=Spirilliplanes yamanashiensis TaxID=42233 RepID=A0A8J3Y315_9ACTN|nr:hypothetical protein [Spirilliplanes yamanashiensis]MDP9814338.1 hypothetical protein [Spirilliplanes yamanashiensis]GIJ00680.1 hypothetical protein Sya03_00320 [Spirilliplanes yamanashiensis]
MDHPDGDDTRPPLSRRRRGAVVAAAALVAAALAAASAARPDGFGMPVAGPVPWADDPAASVPPLLRRAPLPPAPPCDPARLGPLRTDGGGAWHTVNTGPRRCTLAGRPALVAGAGAAVRTVPAVRGRSELEQYPATVEPGEAARVVVEARDCPATGPALTAPRLVIGGAELPMDGLPVSEGCPASVSDWHVVPPVVGGPARVTVAAPPQVRAGGTAEYTVTFDRGLDECPVYLAQFDGAGAWRQLGCRWLARTYTMRLAVPPDANPGDHRLGWRAVWPDGRMTVAGEVTVRVGG